MWRCKSSTPTLDRVHLCVRTRNILAMPCLCQGKEGKSHILGFSNNYGLGTFIPQGFNTGIKTMPVTIHRLARGSLHLPCRAEAHHPRPGQYWQFTYTFFPHSGLFSVLLPLQPLFKLSCIGNLGVYLFMAFAASSDNAVLVDTGLAAFQLQS